MEKENINLESLLLPTLEQGLQELKVTLPKTTLKQLLAYIELLLKWNQIYNLTAVREPKEILTHHILDSLAILPYVQGKHFIDVGTGAGLPGIPLAIVRPEVEVTLLDSIGKKIHFLEQAKKTLQLENVKVVHSRVESYQPAFLFDQIWVRAVGSIKEVQQQTQHLLKEGGSWLFMKGLSPEDELVGSSGTAEIFVVTVPGLQKTRHVVRIQR